MTLSGLKLSCCVQLFTLRILHFPILTTSTLFWFLFIISVGYKSSRRMWLHYKLYALLRNLTHQISILFILLLVFNEVGILRLASLQPFQIFPILRNSAFPGIIYLSEIRKQDVTTCCGNSTGQTSCFFLKGNILATHMCMTHVCRK